MHGRLYAGAGADVRRTGRNVNPEGGPIRRSGDRAFGDKAAGLDSLTRGHHPGSTESRWQRGLSRTSRTRCSPPTCRLVGQPVRGAGPVRRTPETFVRESRWVAARRGPAVGTRGFLRRTPTSRAAMVAVHRSTGGVADAARLFDFLVEPATRGPPATDHRDRRTARRRGLRAGPAFATGWGRPGLWTRSVACWTSTPRRGTAGRAGGGGPLAQRRRRDVVLGIGPIPDDLVDDYACDDPDVGGRTDGLKPHLEPRRGRGARREQERLTTEKRRTRPMKAVRMSNRPAGRVRASIGVSQLPGRPGVRVGRRSALRKQRGTGRASVAKVVNTGSSLKEVPEARRT